MGVIDLFIARYVKEYDFYDQAARLVAQRLESQLRVSGIRCIVTSRAKSVSRLEEKCRQRDRRTRYSAVDDIFDDIVDLAGVRVALYFPAERVQVESIIEREFVQLEAKKEFPGTGDTHAKKKFSGYSASHFRVQLAEADLGDVDRRYSTARVEIQIASVLMHAWAEVEHDLVYKPSSAEDLSEDELALLDQLNGLVLAGEIALERLQRAGELRVAGGGRKFANHYELAVHLLGRARESFRQPINESGLGRVDVLFEFLNRLGFDTPSQMEPYLAALHDNLQSRPLSDQVIDALLAEDNARYPILAQTRARAKGQTNIDTDHRNDEDRQIGRFLKSWIELEKIVRGRAAQKGYPRLVMPTGRDLERLDLLDPDTRVEVDLLGRLRNGLVHGKSFPDFEELSDATMRLDLLIKRLQSDLG